MTNSRLDHWLVHGLDDTLFDHDTGLGGVLNSLLRGPFGTDGETQGAFVLLLGLELVRELRSHVLVVL